jgi:putative tryptophan/tyrosine transport system substrate-binding protein
MRRRDLVKGLVASAACPVAVRAQQSRNVRDVAVLMSYPKDDPEIRGWIATFHEALEKLGWIEGQNIRFEYRWPGTNAAELEQAAKELVTLHPDAILAPSSPATAFALKQTSTIPVIFVNVVDPVGQDFTASLSRPGGNATGLINFESAIATKWIDLLKEIVPTLTRIGVPFNPASAPYAEFYVLKLAAPIFGVEVIPGSVADMVALERFVATEVSEPNTAILPMSSSFTTGHVTELATLMARYRVPALYSVRSFAASGGLMAYGPDYNDNYRQAATFVDRILKGTKPSELPVQFPTKFTLVINLRTAKSLGLTVPLPLQASADEVIE